MSELSTRTALQGTVDGFNIVGSRYDKKYDRQRQQQQDAERMAIQDENIDFRNKAFEEQKRHSQAMEQKSDRRYSAAESLKIKADKRKEFYQRAQLEWKNNTLNGKAFNEELETELIKNNMVYLTPRYWADEEKIKINLALGNVVQQIQSGNLDGINTPENLSAINEAYKEQIEKGVGEFIGPTGQTITGKELAGFRSHRQKQGEKAKVIPMIRVHYDDGTSAVEPMTANRSSSKGDPVALNDPEVMVKDAIGRYKMAKSMATQEARQYLTKIYGNTFGDGKSDQQAGQLSAAGKQITDLMHFGVPKTRAVELTTLAKDNPERAAREFAGDIMDSMNQYEQKITAAEALQEARKALASSLPVEPQSSKAQPPPVKNEMPNAADHGGRTITDTDTGKRYKSDGAQWVEIQ